MVRRLSLLVLVVVALAAGVLLLAGRLLVAVDPLPAHADAIVMLAGSTADRALEVAALYGTGVAPRVVITRTRLPRGQSPLRARGVRLPEEDELARGALEQLGVPGAAIVRLRRRTRSTETEARTIARWACSHRIRSLVVVTSRAHTRRTSLILRRALGPSVTLAVRDSRWDPFSAARWWRVRRDAKIVLYEYERLAHHWLRERWLIEPCGGLRPSPRPPRG